MRIPNPAPNDDRPFDLSPTCRRRFPESLDLRPDRQCRRPHSECAHAIFCNPCVRTFLRAINRLDALHQALRLATVRVRVGSQSGATVGTLERWTAVHSLRARVGPDASRRRRAGDSNAPTRATIHPDVRRHGGRANPILNS